MLHFVFCSLEQKSILFSFRIKHRVQGQTYNIKKMFSQKKTTGKLNINKAIIRHRMKAWRKLCKKLHNSFYRQPFQRS